MFVYDVNSNKIAQEEVYQTANGKAIASMVTELYLFRDKIYMLEPVAQKIEVLDASDYKVLATWDFSEQGLSPIKIAFHPGATSAYVIGENSDQLYVIDLTVNEIAKTIQLPTPASDIETSGSQIYIAIPTKNIITIIDSRNLQIAAELQTAQSPELLAISSDASSLNVVCSGVYPEAGKPKINAMLQVFNLKTLAKIEDKTISIANKIAAKDFYPTSIAVASNNNIYISTENYVLAIRASANYYSNYYSVKDVIQCIYSESFEQLIYTTPTQVIIPNNENGQIEHTIDLGKTIDALVLVN